MVYKINGTVIIDDNSNITANTITCTTPIGVEYLGTGTADANTFLCGDGSWKNVATGNLGKITIDSDGNVYANTVTAYSFIKYTPPPPPHQGEQGFGAGLYPSTLPTNFIELAGTNDPTSDNYGNYLYSDGSVMVFIPAFYYRIGSQLSPRYASYNANAIDIKWYSEYGSQIEANVDGYTLHRAFVDNGQIQPGFFIDKYAASAGTNSTISKSVRNATPRNSVALGTFIQYSKNRGAIFTCMSMFQSGAIQMLSLAHAQECIRTSNSAYCAWYNTTTPKASYPRGRVGATNTGGAVNVTYSGTTDPRPTGGVATESDFAKTTHNGQKCGITDISGLIWQTTIGVHTASDNTTNLWFLKPSVKITSLVDSTTDANGCTLTAANMATKFIGVTNPITWTGFGFYWGNGNTPMLSNAIVSDATTSTDTNWLKTCAFIPNSTSSGVTSSPTYPEMGADGIYGSIVASCFPIVFGAWSDGTADGVFSGHFAGSRSYSNVSLGFRSATYGN